MSRYLFVVSRYHPALYDYMRDHFADEPDVEVVLDRRRGERRRQGAPVAADRRAAERRTREDIAAELRAGSHAFVAAG